MPINNDFDPSKLLYYNPWLIVESNITNPSDALEWALQHDTSHMLSNDDMISRLFDPRIFISDFKSNLDVSALNKTIYESMLVEGFTTDMLERRAKIAPSIYHAAHLVATNTFRFDHLQGSVNTYKLSAKILNVNDVIQLQHAVTKVMDTSTVVEIIDDRTFRIDDARIYTEVGQSFIIIGIKVYDIDRIARINCLRFANVPPYVPPKVQVVMDPEFNPDLYRILYPDARTMGDLACFQDFIQRRDNDEYRIRNADDLGFGSKVNNLSGDSNSLAFGDRDYTTVHSSLVVARHLAVNGEISAKSLRLDEMTITNIFEDVSNLNVDFRFSLGDTSSFIWRDVYVRGMTQDDLRSSEVCNPAEDNLITEWAIKSYVDRPYASTAAFNNVEIHGATAINGSLHIASSNAFAEKLNIRQLSGSNAMMSNLVVSEMSQFHGESVFTGSSTFDGTVLCTERVTMLKDMSVQEIRGDYVTASNLYVTSNLDANEAFVNELVCGLLTCQNGAQLNSNLHAEGEIVFSSIDSDSLFTVNIPTNFNTDVNVNGAITTHSDVTFQGPATFNNGLYASGNCNVLHNVHLSNVSIDEQMLVHVDAKYEKDILYNGMVIGPTICIGPPFTSVDHASSNHASMYDAIVNNLTIKGRAVIGPVDGIALRVHGILQADNFPTVSDRRVKKNIVEMDGIHALEAVNQINSYYYHYMNDTDNARKHLGFMADEVEKWLSGAVIATSNYAYPLECPMRTLANDKQLHLLSMHPILNVGDVLYLNDMKPYRITQLLSEHKFEVDKPIPVNSNKVYKIIIQNLKTIDYTYMIAAAYSAIHHLTNGGGINHIVNGTVTYEKMAENAIGSNQLIDGAVTLPKMAWASVGSNQILESCIDGSKIVQSSITTDLLADESVTYDKLASACVVGYQHINDATITSNLMANDSVGSVHIAPHSILNHHMAPLIVGENELMNGCVSSSKLVDGCVQHNHIADLAILNKALVDSCVNARNLQRGCVTFEKMSVESVGSNQLINNSVTFEKLAMNCLDTVNYRNSSVTFEKLADQSIGFDKLIDQSINMTKLAHDCVGSNQLLNESVIAGKLGYEAVTAHNIATGAVTGEKIDNGAITTSHLTDHSVTTNKLAARSVTSNELAYETIGLQNMSEASIGNMQIIDGSITVNKLAPNSVGTIQLQSRCIVTSNICFRSVGSDEIMEQSVMNQHLAPLSVSSDTLIPGCVSSVALGSNSVYEGHITTSAITSNKLAPLCINDNHIANLSIHHRHIANDSVGSNQLINGSITASKLSDVLGAQSIGCHTLLCTSDISLGSKDARMPTTELISPIVILSDELNVKDNGIWCVTSSSGIADAWRLFDKDADTFITSDQYTGASFTYNGTEKTYCKNSQGATTIIAGDWIQLELPSVRTLKGLSLTVDGLEFAPKVFSVVVSADGSTDASQAFFANRWNLAHEESNAQFESMSYNAIFTQPIICNVIRLVITGLGYSTRLRIVNIEYLEEQYADINMNGNVRITGNLLLNGETPHTGQVTSSQISDAAITIDKLAVESVGTSQLVNESVTMHKLSQGCVGSNQLATGSVNASKLSYNSVGSLQLTDGAVTFLKLSENAVATMNIMDASITTQKLGNSAVTSAKISPEAVTTSHIADASITAMKMSINSVQTQNLLNECVTRAKLANNAVGAMQIMDGSIQARHLASDVSIGSGSSGDTFWTQESGTSNIFFTSTSNVVDGCVGIGTQYPIQKLHVHGNILASGSITSPSDLRLKTGIEKIENALDKICRLSGYTYYRTDINSGRKMTGLIAQEVQQVLPEVVHQRHDDDIMHISYGEMMGLVVESIKELKDLLFTKSS